MDIHANENRRFYTAAFAINAIAGSTALTTFDATDLKFATVTAASVALLTYGVRKVVSLLDKKTRCHDKYSNIKVADNHGVPEHVFAEVSDLASQMGLKKAVEVRAGKRDSTDTFRSVLCLSQETIDGTEDKRKYIIAHELSHIKNKDMQKFAVLIAPAWTVSAYAFIQDDIRAVNFILEHVEGNDLATKIEFLNDYIGEVSQAFQKPVDQLVSVLGIGAHFLTRMFANRTKEYRCDREAVQAIGDLEGAKKLMLENEGIHNNFSIISTHPSSSSRLYRLMQLQHHNMV